jgi:RimJ/RimL family protein N-acetyltransferase
VELEPLSVEHAQEMAPLLDDPGLHTFIGGRPATLLQLQEQYRRQVVGRSPDGAQRWLNWVVRRREDGCAIGTVQATVTEHVAVEGGPAAEVAWVVATAHQGQGYAGEAAPIMIAWLRAQGVETILAYVHPEHEASRAVARAIGLVETTTVVDGETLWQGPATSGR